MAIGFIVSSTVPANPAQSRYRRHEPSPEPVRTAPCLRLDDAGRREAAREIARFAADTPKPDGTGPLS
jgi:hypothetical protein